MDLGQCSSTFLSSWNPWCSFRFCHGTPINKS